MKTLNTIKRLNMESVYYVVFEKPDYENKNNDGEKICTVIENNEDFKKLFFFIDEESHCYFYQTKDEQQVIDFLSDFFNVELLNNSSAIMEYRKELLENMSGDYIELKTYLGKIVIKESALYESLHDEYLNEEEYVQRLVNAKDFYNEMKQIKKECLNYLFDMNIRVAREELEKYEIEMSI